MNTTQEHLLISDIYNDILLLKNGGGALVLQVWSVNFGLLSEREQGAIIFAFAQMLNSLSFTIQIIIHSERLNIGSYLTTLDSAQKAQTNPLLSQMIIEYKEFIQSTIKENEVLDKKFYVVIPLFSLELGLTSSKANLEQKIKTVLIPRRDQIARQLSRVGLKTMQLTGQKLIEAFYDIYNGEALEKSNTQPVPEQLIVRLKNPQQPLINQDIRQSAPVESKPVASNTPAPLPPVAQAVKTHPFVVEELQE